MKSIMWVQSDSPGGKDYFFVDDVLVLEDDDTTRQTCVKTLIRAQNKRYQNTKEIERLRRESGSPNFTIAYCPFMGLLYKSIFNEKSADNRNKAFALWCNNASMQSCWDIAKMNASKLGYTLRDIENKIVQESISKNNRRTKNALIAGLTIIALIAIAYATHKH